MALCKAHFQESTRFQLYTSRTRIETLLAATREKVK